MKQKFIFDKDYWDNLHPDLQRAIKDSPYVELTING
tara:strand:- start:7785 stop:7892 length:108 start_codon:yes stop_codon:yes gene_type:complete